MNPILQRPGRLLPYLGLWVPFAGILALLLAAAAELTATEALLTAFPLSAFYAFLCLGSWYICKVTPLKPSNLVRVGVTLSASSAIASCLWVLCLGTLVNFVSFLPGGVTMPDRLPRMVPTVFGMGVLLYLLTAALHYVMLALADTRRLELEEAKSRELAREAELTALKAQVNPHFLFNALNSISALTASDPMKAREMCNLLGDYLRKTLGLSQRRSVSLGEEISLANHYLAVEKVRFGDRLQFEQEIDPAAESYEVPPLLLQPLVENAIKHGASSGSGGQVRLVVKRLLEEIEIGIENPVEESDEPRPGTGLGLKLVSQRIRNFYGPRGRMAQTVSPGRFRIELGLPFVPGTG
jgi:hypothetical protein